MRDRVRDTIGWKHLMMQSDSDLQPMRAVWPAIGHVTAPQWPASGHVTAQWPELVQRTRDKSCDDPPVRTEGRVWRLMVQVQHYHFQPW